MENFEAGQKQVKESKTSHFYGQRGEYKEQFSKCKKKASKACGLFIGKQIFR